MFTYKNGFWFEFEEEYGAKFHFKRNSFQFDQDLYWDYSFIETRNIETSGRRLKGYWKQL